MSKKYIISSNVINKKVFRGVTESTLEFLAETLKGSFGPYGSNSAINEDAGKCRYSKDGRTILDSIRFNGVIEENVRQDVREITRVVDMKVGDGTTSSIILASLLYKELNKLDTKYNPYQVIRELNDIVDLVSAQIMENRKEFNADEAYKISKISTNGDEFLSRSISDIYKRFGNEVYIDIKRSNDSNTKIKVTDGLLVESGYSDPAYVNRSNGTCELNNPEIYVFTNNIDTPEMSGFMRQIINSNIFEPLQELSNGEESTIVPTVIFAPFISRDQAPYLEQLILKLGAMDNMAKLPLLIVTYNKDTQGDKIDDIAKLCGCKSIQKYIDFDQQEADIKEGLAPTLDTLWKFAGTTEKIISDADSTKFINPSLMWENISENKHSTLYNSMISFLESAIDDATNNNESIVKISKLKKRLQSLKANMVELYIGGISSTDRDYYQDLAVDAVKNTRSASRSGVGYGANTEGLIALDKLIKHFDKNDLKSDLINILYKCYCELVNCVYKDITDVNYKTILTHHKPINIVTKEISTDVVCSIETDIEILKSVVKIVAVLFTSNQFIANNPAIASGYQNVEDFTEIEL